jgi:hypothetical protein
MAFMMPRLQPRTAPAIRNDRQRQRRARPREKGIRVAQVRTSGRALCHRPRTPVRISLPSPRRR